MSAIKQALAKLEDAVNYLDLSIEEARAKKAPGTAQADMFADTPQGQAVAKRLDRAIEKVESMLQEA